MHDISNESSFDIYNRYRFFSYLGDKIFIIYLYPWGHMRLERELPKIQRHRSFIRGSEETANTLYKYRRERRAYLRDILLVAAVMCTNSATEIASVVTEKLRRPIIKVLHQRSVMLRSRSLARVYYMRYCCNEAQWHNVDLSRRRCDQTCMVHTSSAKRSVIT